MANESTIDVAEGSTSAGGSNVASERLREFQGEVNQLRVTGGRANPEKNGLILGFVAWAAAIVLELVAYFTSHGTKDALEQRDMIILACFGIVAAVIGTGLVVRFALDPVLPVLAGAPDLRGPRADRPHRRRPRTPHVAARSPCPGPLRRRPSAAPGTA